MKVALFIGFGSSNYPDFLKDQLPGTSFVKDRIKLASLLEALEPTHEEPDYEVHRAFEAGTLPLDYIKYATNPDNIYVKDHEYNYIVQIAIREVDNSRLWKIDDYDGAESISYFKEPEVVDEEYNYGRW